jgi:hypothetical protein
MHHRLLVFILLSAFALPVMSAHAANNEDGLTKHVVLVPKMHKSQTSKHHALLSHHSQKNAQIVATLPPMKPAVQTILSKSLWQKNAVPKRESLFTQHHLFLVTLQF